MQHDDGVLALLKPLLGSVVVSKLRPDGEVLGKPRTLEGAKAAGTLGGGAAADAYLQLGGPRHEYRASTSTAAVLELVLRHDTQPSSTDAAMPPLLPPDADAPPLLLDALTTSDSPAADDDAAPAVDATADAGDAAAAAKRKVRSRRRSRPTSAASSLSSRLSCDAFSPHGPIPRRRAG